MMAAGLRNRAAGLVGREAELARVEAAVAAVAPASGHALLIRGEPGVGKSRLLEAVVEAADGRLRVVTGTASALESDLPFAPLVRALRLQPDTADDGAAAVGALLAEHDVADPDLRRLHVIEAIADLLERWALAQPVLLAVEDLHWADTATLQTLDRLARRLRHVGVLIAGTARPHPRPPALDVLEDTIEKAGGDTVELSPLGDEDAMEVARRALGAAPGPRLATAVRHAGGNPLYISELVAAARSDMADSGQADLPRAGVPESVRLTILRNLSFLPSSTLELLRTASVLGAHFDVRHLARTVDRSDVEVLNDLRPAFAGQVLSDAGERVAFRHDVIREAVYEDQSRLVRAATHRQIVERLRGAGTPVEDLVPHLLRGSWKGVPEAVSWLAEAGRAMRGRSLPLATELLARAVDQAGQHADPDLRLDLAEVLAAAGRARDIAATVKPVLATPLNGLSERTRDRLVPLASPITWPTRTTGEHAALLDSLEAAGLGPRGRSQAMGMRAWLHWVEGRREKAADLASEALAIATDAEDHVTACVLELVLTRGEEGQNWDELPVAHARRALEHARLVPSRPELLLVASTTLALQLGNDATLRPEADRVVSEALALADRTGLEKHQIGLEAVAALNAQRSGDWQGAAVRFETALAALGGDLAPGAGAGGTAMLYARAASLHVHQGQLERAADHLRAARRLSSRRHTPAEGHDELVTVHLAEAELRLALGDRDAAVDAVHEMVAFVDARGIPVYHAGKLPAVTAIAWQADCREEARAAVERAEHWLAGNAIATPDFNVLARWGRARLECDVAALDELVAWADGPRPLWEWRPQIREDAAAVLAETGDHGRAVQRLDEALALWDAAGATRDVDRVRKALRELGVRRGRGSAAARPDTGWASLTDMEWRVVELVTDGLIYREIGERLFISRRTVETHVQHVFRKLGVSSRRELTLLVTTEGAHKHLTADG